MLVLLVLVATACSSPWFDQSNDPRRLDLLAVTGASKDTEAESTRSRVDVALRLPPDSAALVLDLEARLRGRDAGSRLAVWAHDENGGAQQLLDRELTAELRERVDLGAWAGRELLLSVSVQMGPRPRIRWRELAIEVEGQSDAGGGDPASWHIVAPVRAPNVLLYVIDALRNDVLDRPEDAPATVQLRRMAAEGVRFTTTWTAATWTRAAMASLLTGLYSSVHGVQGRDDVLPEAAWTLAERFRAAGYATAAVVSNPNIAAHWGFDQGFEVYDRARPEGDDDNQDAGEIASSHPARAEQVHELALGALSRLDRSRPFLMYVHTVEPHAPYDPSEWLLPGERPAGAATPEVLGGLDGEGADERTIADLRTLYRGELAYADRELARFLEALRARGALDNTIVVVTSDHGEQFAEHDRFGHGRTLFEEELRVPLVVWGPGVVPARGDVTRPASLVDVGSTLLSLAKVAVDFGNGEDLSEVFGAGDGSAPPPARALLAELALDGRNLAAIRWDDWKLVHDRRAESYRMHNLASDPRELRDLFDELGTANERVTALSRLLADWTDRLAAARLDPAGARPAPSSELLEQLRALGYLQ